MTFRIAVTSMCVLPGMVAAQTPTPRDATVARVDTVFARWNSTGTPGCAVAASRDGATVVSRAYGMSDLENDVRNTPATIFEAGSVSKQFTAAAVMLLVQDGRLALDDDVRKYVPELPDYGTTIRIRHLLNHTSGLRDWGSVASIAGWGRESRTHDHDHVLDILKRQRALNFAPGEQYSYSNSGYNLLAIIVSRVSGTSFAEFSSRRIFAPLGMTHTQWRDDYTRIVKGRSSAYNARGQGFAINRPIENVHGNGGLLTTVGDMLIWNEALAGGRLGGMPLTQLMQTRGVLTSGDTIEYAAGLFITRYNGVREVSHTGSTSGYRAFLAHYPDQKVGVAVLCNVGAVNPGTVGHQVADALLNLPRVARAATPPAPRPMPVEPPGPIDASALTGEYYSPDAETTLTVSADNGRLLLHRRPATTMTLTPAARDEFTAGIGRVRFIRDTSGRVVQLSVQQARVFDLRFDRVK